MFGGQQKLTDSIVYEENIEGIIAIWATSQIERERMSDEVQSRNQEVN